jgi:hypothetical protein
MARAESISGPGVITHSPVTGLGLPACVVAMAIHAINEDADNDMEGEEKRDDRQRVNPICTALRDLECSPEQVREHPDDHELQPGDQRARELVLNRRVLLGDRPGVVEQMRDPVEQRKPDVDHHAEHSREDGDSPVGPGGRLTGWAKVIRDSVRNVRPAEHGVTRREASAAGDIISATRSQLVRSGEMTDRWLSRSGIASFPARNVSRSLVGAAHRFP